jgi:serine/threonine protein kinase
MELVDGETLADQIARGPIPIPEALQIAKQIADALEATHEAGVIHRDLKPANVKVRPDGAVKVLDFGLAKALAKDPLTSPATLTNSPTLTIPLIEPVPTALPHQSETLTSEKRPSSELATLFDEDAQSPSACLYPVYPRTVLAIRQPSLAIPLGSNPCFGAVSTNPEP